MFIISHTNFILAAALKITKARGKSNYGASFFSTPVHLGTCD